MTVVPINRSAGSTRSRQPQVPQVIAALDIGTTKISCLIGEPVRRQTGADGRPAVVVKGAGHQAARGVRCGSVISIEEAERAIRLAVDQAERMAGTTIAEVFVNVSGGRPLSRAYRGTASVGGGPVGEDHKRRAVADAFAKLDQPGRVLVHGAAVAWSLDDAAGIERPEGMYGAELGVDVNVVTAEPGALRNLALAIERCHLSVAGFVIAPYASGRAALAADEAKLGSVVLDLGGATTSIAVFHDGELAYADVLNLGGQHITADLARGLSTTVAHAERMKTLYGSTLPVPYDDHETLTVPNLGELGVDAVHKVARSMLTGIIQPRMEEILEIVRDRLDMIPIARHAARRVVLTGGASQLTGLPDLAQRILGRPVRLGRVPAYEGLPEAMRTAGFTVACGLIDYALRPDRLIGDLPALAMSHGHGNYLVRVGRWIRESF